MAISCSVVDVTWEGTVLRIVVHGETLRLVNTPLGHESEGAESSTPEDDARRLEFELQAPGRSIPIKASAFDIPEAYEIQMNVINIQNRREIPDGKWKLVPLLGRKRCDPADFDATHASKLAEWSRTFLFDDNRQAYVVNFDITTDDNRPEFIICIHHYSQPVTWRSTTGDWRRRLHVYLTRGGALSKFLQSWYDAWRFINASRRNCVVFVTQRDASLDGNLRCLRDRIVQRGLDRRYRLCEWSKPKAPGFGRLLWSWLKLSKLMAGADYIFIDEYCELLDYIIVAPKAVLTQLWHAGYGFKAAGFARFGRDGSPRLDCGHRQYTYAICGSRELTPVYSEVFGIEEEAILPTGLPRVDEFLDTTYARHARASFFNGHPELASKRIVLFAPTYRGRGSTNAYYDYQCLDFQALADWCGAETVILFRMHQFIRTPPPIPKEFASRLIDFSSYPNTNPLLYSADVLITDYSSIVYEYSLLNRPILFFAYDEALYGATRGLHGNYREIAPGKICSNFNELMSALQNEDFELERVEDYRNRYFDYTDTKSTDRVIDQILLGRELHKER